jgi:hypothetical protein
VGHCCKRRVEERREEEEKISHLIRKFFKLRYAAL